MCMMNVLRPRDIVPRQTGFRCTACGQFILWLPEMGYFTPCQCVQRWISVGEVVEQEQVSGTATVPVVTVEYEPVYKGWTTEVKGKCR